MIFLLLDWSLRMSVILGLALVAVHLLRRQSAALRHWILSAAILAAALTPALSFVLPSLDFHLAHRVPSPLPQEPAEASTQQEVETVATTLPEKPEDRLPKTSVRNAPVLVAQSTEPKPPAMETNVENTPPPVGDQGIEITPPPAQASPLNSETLLTVVWLAGMLMGLAALAAGTARLRWIASGSARVVDAAWLRFADNISRDYRLRRPLRLLRSHRPSILATWGTFRPEVLLPSSSDSWPEDRIHVVLSHELAHIRRGDWLIQMLAETVRALYWFNPLVWLVCSRLHHESERACDDAVLGRGVIGADYAAHLLDLARSLKASRRVWAPALMMARSSTLEGRFNSMLNPNVNRRPVTRFSVLATVAMFLAITIPVVAFRVAAAPAPEAAVPAVEAVEVVEPVEPVEVLEATLTEVASPLQQPLQYGTISGRVTSMDGMPAANVRVTAIGSDGKLANIAKTDAEGRYLLPRLAVGGYTLAVGMIDQPTYFPGVADRTKATFVNVTPGPPNGFDLTMVVPAGPIVGGRVATEMLKTIYLNPDTTEEAATELLTTLNNRLQTMRIVWNRAASAIVVRDAPDTVSLVQRIVAEMEKPPARTSRGAVLMDGIGNVFTVEGSSAPQNVSPARSQLHLAANRPISFSSKQDVRTAYETLASATGLNVILVNTVNATEPLVFRAENLNIVDVLDALSEKTGTFWQPMGGGNVVVAPNNLTHHRALDPKVTEVIQLSKTANVKELNDMVSALRTLLRLTSMFPSRNAIVLSDSQTQIALAERIVADLDMPGVPTRFPLGNAIMRDVLGNLFVTEAGVVRSVTPKRSGLQVKQKDPVSIRIDDNERVAYETLAKIAGLNVIFDANLQSSRADVNRSFRVENVDIVDALDLLAIHSTSFWQPLGPKTIYVSPNTATSHRDLDPLLLKTIYLTDGSNERMNELIQLLRTVATLISVFPDQRTKAILLRDTPDKVAFAEWLILALDPGASSSPAPGTVASAIETDAAGNLWLLERGERRNITPARSQLGSLPNTTSLDLNGTTRSTYIRLGGFAGLGVVFDPRFQDRTQEPVRLNDVDALDALDYFGVLTRNFWKAVDRNTILVAPNNSAARRELDPQISKSITLSSVKAPEDVLRILQAVRTMIGISGISPDGLQHNPTTNTLELKTTPNMAVLAEKIITDLDRPERR